MNRSGPVMELCIEENESLWFKNDKNKVAKRNAVEARDKIQFPQDLLSLLGGQRGEATVERVTCVHMFETNP